MDAIDFGLVLNLHQPGLTPVARAEHPDDRRAR
jgi:hypothetical protein